MGRIGYFISEGSRGLFQAKLMTFVSIATIAVVLFISGIVGVAAISMWAQLNHAVERADFVVYLSDNAAADQAMRENLLDAIGSFPEVKSVVFVDRDSALGRFTRLYGTEMLSAVEGNPLPASFEISLSREYRTAASAAALKERLVGLPGVEGVRFAREWLEFLGRLQHWFFCGAAALIAGMIAALHLTISNTIKLTIYARQELVRTMHLVGATRFFISMPFIVEGMMQGCIGGALAMIFFFIIKAVFTAEPSLRQLPLEWGPALFPLGFLITGVVFGWLGSVFAVRKFLA